MSFNTVTLTTIAQCDAAIAMANNKKDDLLFALTAATRESNSVASRRSRNASTLSSVNAQIAVVAAGVSAATDAAVMKKLNSQLRKLNDRKDNLEEAIENGSSGTMMEDELEKALL